MVITLWFIWQERNIVREEGRRRSAEALVRSIGCSYNEAIEGTGGGRPSNNRQAEKWSKPPLKLNCDASFTPSPGSGSWGFLVRDSDGDVVVARRGRVESTY